MFESENSKKMFCLFLSVVLLLFADSRPVIAGQRASGLGVETFQQDRLAQEPKSFAALVGDWYVSEDNGNKVLCVDGRKWSKGKVSVGVADKSRALYGSRYAEFLDRVQTFAYFPLSVYKGVDSFKNGEISFRFKGVAGRIDQCAGIAFNIKPSGDYLILRANCLENNIVLWKYVNGRRSPLKWVQKIVTPPGQWFTLSMRVRGKKISGALNGQPVFDFENTEPIDGRVGLWSKADSVMYFDDYSVKVE